MLEPVRFDESPTIRFFEMMQHRELIRLSKEAGAPYPWTRDPILGKFKFTNVKRENDWTTKGFKKIYDEHSDEDWLLLFINAAIFRYFGTVPFARAIGWSPTFGPGRREEIRDIARRRLANDEVVFTNAYVISNAGIRGPKEDVVVNVFLKSLWENAMSDLQDTWDVTKSWREVGRAMSTVPGFGGTGFMVKEVLLDVMMTPAMRGAVDADTWTPVGPGAARGLARVFGEDLKKALYLLRILELRDEYHDYFKNSGFMPRVTAHDIQFQLCEFDKYERVRLGEGRPRNDYHPRSA